MNYLKTLLGGLSGTNKASNPEGSSSNLSKNWSVPYDDVQSPRSNLNPSKDSIPYVYTMVDSIRTCVDIYADIAESVNYNILYNEGYDPKDSKIIASSKDIRPRHPFMGALRRYRYKYNINLIKRLVYSSLLYDSSYIQLIREMGVPKDLKWLNPIGVTIQYDQDGDPEYFDYSWDAVYSLRMTPDELAYDHGFNPYADNEGVSLVLSVIASLDTQYQLDSYLRDVFINNARPTLVASFRDAMYGKNMTMFNELVNIFERYLKGKGNQGRSLISPIPLDFQTFDQPDVSKNIVIREDIRKTVYSVFRVPLSMSGDSSTTRYKDTVEARAGFITSAVKPLLTRLQDYINDSIMVFYDPTGSTRLEFDFRSDTIVTDLDRLSRDIITSDLQNNLITFSHAQKELGLPVDPDMDKYMYQLTLEMQSQAQSSPTDTPPQPNPSMGTMGGNVPVEDPISSPNGSTTNPTNPITGEQVKKALYDNDDLLDMEEIKKWQRMELNRIGKKKRFFESDNIELFVRKAIVDLLDANPDTTQGVNKAFAEFRETDIYKTANTYRTNARRVLRSLYDGNTSYSDAKNALNELVSSEYLMAYNRGLKAGGMRVSDAVDADYELLQIEVSKEQAYIPSLVNMVQLMALDPVKPREAMAQVRMKIEAWVSRLDKIESIGKMYASSTFGKRLKWVFNPRKEHCSDCEYLNGKIYRAAIWLKMGISPKSPKLECFGVYCGCTLVEPSPDEKTTRGRPARWKSVHDHEYSGDELHPLEKWLDDESIKFDESEVNRDDDGRFAEIAGTQANEETPSNSNDGNNSDSNKKPSSQENRPHPHRERTVEYRWGSEATMAELESLGVSQEALLANGGFDALPEEFDNSKVQIYVQPQAGGYRARASITNSNGLNLDRVVNYDTEGNIVSVTNEYFTLPESAQGTGIGTEVFSSQVQALRTSRSRDGSYPVITTEAARGDESEDLNGYYTWARMGYDADVPKQVFDTHAYDIIDLTGTETPRISDLMATPEGRAFWRENGISTVMTFDTNPDSRSSRILDAYNRERASRGKSMKQEDKKPNTKPKDTFIFEGQIPEEDESLLDEIWKRVIKEEHEENKFSESDVNRDGNGQFAEVSGTQANEETPSDDNNSDNSGKKPSTSVGREYPHKKRAVEIDDSTRSHLERLEPQGVSEQRILSESGFDGLPEEFDDADVGIEIQKTGNGYRATSTLYARNGVGITRSIDYDNQGNITNVHNDHFVLHSSHRGTGIGTDVFSSQVQALRSSRTSDGSYPVIVTEASQGFGKNGYYTWARLGYDADVPNSVLRNHGDAISRLTNNTSNPRISDLMATPEGRAFWRDNGMTVNMSFDTDPDSTSSRILDAYNQERTSRGKSMKQEDEKPSIKPEDTFIFEGQIPKEDEELLDAIWERVIKEEQEKKKG